MTTPPPTSPGFEKDPKMDIVAQGLRGRGFNDYIDVRVTHLDCDSYVRSGKSVEALFDEHIRQKRLSTRVQ